MACLFVIVKALYLGIPGPLGSRSEMEKCMYEGWNFNFGNTLLDWIQELLE